MRWPNSLQTERWYHLHPLWFHCSSHHCSWSEDGRRLRTENLPARWGALAFGRETESEWATCSWMWRSYQTEVSSLNPSSTKEKGGFTDTIEYTLKHFFDTVMTEENTQTLLEWMSGATRLWCEWISGRLISGSGRRSAGGGTEGWLWVWLGGFSGA